MFFQVKLRIVKEWVGRSPAAKVAGGKSGQDRARWWLTATGGDPRESATENKPPAEARSAKAGKGEMVR